MHLLTPYYVFLSIIVFFELLQDVRVKRCDLRCHFHSESLLKRAQLFVFVWSVNSSNVQSDIFGFDFALFKQSIELSSPDLIGFSCLADLRLPEFANKLRHFEAMPEKTLLVHSEQLLSHFVFIVRRVDVESSFAFRQLEVVGF